MTLGNLATSYKALKQYKKAESAYKMIIELSPGNVRTYRQLADLYRIPELGKQDEIPSVLEKGLVHVPNEPDLLSYLAVYYQEKGNVEKAISYYEQLLKVAPQNQAAQQELNKLRLKE